MRSIRAASVSLWNWHPAASRAALDFGVGVFGSVVDVAHDEGPRLLEDLVLDVERRADGGSGVMGGGLDVDVAEVRPVEDHSVGDAVQSHAAGQADSSSAGLLLDEVQEREVVLLQDELDGGGEVHMALLDFRAGLAGLAELLRHFGGEDGAEGRFAALPGHLDALAVMGEVVEVEAALAVARCGRPRGRDRRSAARHRRRGPSFCTRRRTWGSRGIA